MKLTKLTLLGLMALLVGCDSNPEMYARFGDSEVSHLFTEDSTGDKFLITHHLGDTYTVVKCGKYTTSSLLCPTGE